MRMFKDVEERIWFSKWQSKTKQLKTVMDYFRTNISKFTHEHYKCLIEEGSPVYKQIIELASSVFPDHKEYLKEQAEYSTPGEVKIERINLVFEYIERLLKLSEEKVDSETQLQKIRSELETLRQRCSELENQNKLLVDQLVLLQKSHRKILEMAPLASLTKFLEEVQPHLGVDENWAISTCALVILDLAVKKRLEGLGEYSGDSFEACYRRLVEAIKRKERRDVERFLPRPFHDARNKLVHAGHIYKPTPEETEMIVKYVTSFVKDLFPAESTSD